jgi:hypothetical protein
VGDAVRLVHRDERRRPLGEHLGEARDARDIRHVVARVADRGGGRSGRHPLDARARERLGALRLIQSEIKQFEVDAKLAEADITKLRNEYDKVNKAAKSAQLENSKLKARIQKLKNKRFRIEDNQKICKKCGKEYLEKENYNWSCRTHTSEYSGEMWWCCGKTSKEADGCKISKHECKEDDEDDAAEQENKDDQSKQLKNVRCYCCKEIGHTIDKCPRDPNLKTNEAIGAEQERIQKIKDYRKLFADTMITTSHFLK